jgi:hypothetical protein
MSFSSSQQKLPFEMLADYDSGFKAGAQGLVSRNDELGFLSVPVQPVALKGLDVIVGK